MEVMHARCCGIDVHKESVVACLRLQEGRRAKTDVRQFGTTTAELLRLHEWLAHAACTHVGMESTSVYWRPVFNLLEGSFDVVLANAHHIKAVPGRKTDVKDCEWIANLRDPAAANHRRRGTPLGGGDGVRDRGGHVAVLDRRAPGLVGTHLPGQPRERREATEHGNGLRE